MKSFYPILFLLLPGISWGACFSDKITELANSGKVYKAKVIANQRLSAGTCKLTLTIAGTKITGEAKGRLCRAPKKAVVKVNVHAFCCDTPPCDKNRKNKIWFTEPTLAVKAAKPAMAKVTKSASKQPPPAGAGILGTLKNLQPKAKPPVIKNGAHLSSNGSLGVGKSSATSAAVVTKSPSKELPSETLALATASAEAVEITKPLDQYKVELGVDGQMQKPGPPGELKVWIGDPKFSAHFSADMATTETTVPAIGQSAKVTPYAPDFDITPKESICFKVDPSGSETHFSITPKATGTFKVGADVLLYASDMCEGLPVPKSAATLKVEVVVNKEGVAKNHLLQLWEIFWQGILDFWTWLVATIAGLFVFLIRKRLKKWFGFDAPDAGSSNN